MVAFRYSVMRVMVFAFFFALLLLLKMDLLPAAVVAALASMVVSYFLLARDREAIASGIERRVGGRVTRKRRESGLDHSAEEDEDAEADGRA
ncbi:DUF4229 domain-containing protein [Ornithinimicrobium avium]|uniref:DUF4229 domain-containing protein n=1 Tax=Ornithinimicrobium avium TaxID=2283195 RepID=A0A345NQB2_9MICO|nr:DUF4229 domain-containing protein [Ornithinimicrobium avium]AXH97220.1 DUF4229 domain-containing protein [Ornithinimicrobium avium]